MMDHIKGEVLQSFLVDVPPHYHLDPHRQVHREKTSLNHVEFELLLPPCPHRELLSLSKHFFGVNFPRHVVDDLESIVRVTQTSVNSPEVIIGF